MPEHRLAKLPEISADESADNLKAHQLVKVEVRCPCICGDVVRSSDIMPGTVVMDVDQFILRVRQVTGRSRTLWEEHLANG